MTGYDWAFSAIQTMNIAPNTRFVVLTQDYFPDIGGITTWVYEFARHLQQKGFEVLIVTKAFDGFDGRESCGLPVLRLDHHRWKQKKYGRLKAAVASLNDGRTIFLCANWKMAVPCMFLSIYTRIPYFVAVYGLDALENRLKNRLLQKYTLWRAAGVLPISRYTRDLLDTPVLKRTGRVHIVATGVDTARFTPRPRNPEIEKKYGMTSGVRILNVGRLIERKGFDTTIRAMARLTAREAHFYIGGQGPYEAALKTLAEQMGVSDRVHFLGFVADADLVDVYNAADIFCMPSRELPNQVEGYGITYLEAAACGVPSIGGKNSGAEDAIVDGETGFLVEADSAGAIARALDRLISDDELRKEMGTQALNRVRRELTWAAAVDRLLAVIAGS